MSGSVRILLVEDDPSVSLTFEAVLSEEGFLVTVADSCAHALKVASGAGPFDVALVDQHLSDGEGLSLVPALKNMFPSAKFFLLTGLPEAHQGNTSVDGVLGKGDPLPLILQKLRALEFAL